MKRTILIFTLGYIIGIFWGLYYKSNIAFLYLIIFAIILIFKVLFKFQKGFKLISLKRYLRYIKIIITKKILILLLLSSFISNSIVTILNYKYESFYNSIDNTSKIIAEIVSEKTEKDYYNAYFVKVKSINNNKFRNIYLMIQTNKKMKFEYGTEVEFSGEYIKPSKQRNYKGFNYSEYLKTKKCFGTIKVLNIEKLKENSISKVLMYSNKFSNKIKNNIHSIMPEKYSSILVAILLGDKAQVDEEIISNFQISSISHIIAVSGMHVSILIIGLSYIFKNSGKKNLKILLSIFLLFYMILTNFSVSVVRAVVMAICIQFSGIVHRKSDIFTNISISAIILLIYNPFFLKAISFQLTFVGTIGIILFQKNILNQLNKIKVKRRYRSRNYKVVNVLDKVKEILSVTFSAQLAILPILIINVHYISTYFILSNLIISIFIEPVVITGILLIVISFISLNIAKLTSFVFIIFLEPILKISELIANFKFNIIYMKTPYIISIFVYFSFILILNFISNIYYLKNPNFSQIRVKNLISLAKYKIRLKKKEIVSVILILIIIFSIINVIPKNLKIYFIDVGQGDSTLVVTPKNKTILIDGGGSEKSSFDVGEKTLLPYLLARRVKSIDYIVISHFDQDHVGGILTIIDKLKVRNIIIAKQFESSENYKKFISIVNKNKIKVNVVDEGQRIVIENNLYIDVLWPSLKNKVNENVLNNNSLVCKLKYKNFSMMFTGDIEEIGEKEMLKLYKSNSNLLNADILKVAHHGSKSSSRQELLDKVSPKIALIGVGANNTYGHPNEEIIEKLENMKCKIYRTDENGEISIIINSKGKYKINQIISD